MSLLSIISVMVQDSNISYTTASSSYTYSYINGFYFAINQTLPVNNGNLIISNVVNSGAFNSQGNSTIYTNLNGGNTFAYTYLTNYNIIICPIQVSVNLNYNLTTDYLNVVLSYSGQNSTYSQTYGNSDYNDISQLTFSGDFDVLYYNGEGFDVQQYTINFFQNYTSNMLIRYAYYPGTGAPFNNIHISRGISYYTTWSIQECRTYNTDLQGTDNFPAINDHILKMPILIFFQGSVQNNVNFIITPGYNSIRFKRLFDKWYFGYDRYGGSQCGNVNIPSYALPNDPLLTATKSYHVATYPSLQGTSKSSKNYSNQVNNNSVNQTLYQPNTTVNILNNKSVNISSYSNVLGYIPAELNGGTPYYTYLYLISCYST